MVWLPGTAWDFRSNFQEFDRCPFGAALCWWSMCIRCSNNPRGKLRLETIADSVAFSWPCLSSLTQVLAKLAGGAPALHWELFGRVLLRQLAIEFRNSAASQKRLEAPVLLLLFMASILQ